jgi:hypothetical protein
MGLDPSQYCLFIAERNKYMANELPIASYAVIPSQILALKQKEAGWKPDAPIVQMLGVNVENIEFRSPTSGNVSVGPTGAAFESWSVEQVCEWLKGIGMEEYTECFRQGNVDGKGLALCTPASLRDLGVQALGVRKEIIRQIRNLK